MSLAAVAAAKSRPTIFMPKPAGARRKPGRTNEQVAGSGRTANGNRGERATARRKGRQWHQNPAVTPRAVAPCAARRKLGIDPEAAGHRPRRTHSRARRAGRGAEDPVSHTFGTAAIRHRRRSTLRSRQAVRRTIARRMVASHQTTAPVTLTTRVDATNLVNLRRQFRAAAPTQDLVPSISDLLVKLLSIALADHPRLNARWEEEQIVELAEIRVGSPSMPRQACSCRYCGTCACMGIRQIAARSRELVARARAGSSLWARVAGGDDHHDEPGDVRHRRLYADHQPARGRDPGRWARSGASRCSSMPIAWCPRDNDAQPDVRPSRGRRRPGGAVSRHATSRDRKSGRLADGVTRAQGNEAMMPWPMQLPPPPANDQLPCKARCRSGTSRTTFQARPNFSMARIIQ